MTESTTPEQLDNFSKLAAINVSKHIEKKNGLSYLSWAWAVDQLMRLDPQANWVFREPVVYPDGSMMVHCDITVYGKTMYMFLPVMNYSNKAIANPNAVDINKAMMRCLVKGIAVHGLGLYIYAGEDLPEEEKQATMHEQNQGSQQPNQQQNQNTQQPVQQQAAPPKPKDTRTQQQIYDSALATIQKTEDRDVLLKAARTFKGTKYETSINKACRARSDQMGWPTKQTQRNQNSPQQPMHH
ncbi:DUF1071 domain-containing protein [Acinetobacter sichuanensis]|uniref:DUF1071 domain-containing protein n=1 Tax=Acinetobacter sichuanensis TaxID=2136183 RepID=A0A371YJH6_9GAMM|nr:DUF1071 domain-containing protein [Acinetobacter sichuanensis]RFC81586.1 DUF1071 domain-containing protein [Acinetobacter sichuanensis]